ncbi:hypothetical protein, partial [Priestia sp. TGN 0903]|uniref:hypothetical protein n=1 Tax=Priestia sp. TGN 0903 TaxID=3420730 RepID=UPI003D783B12
SDVETGVVTRAGVSVVRVRDTATGHHVTISADLADSDKARYKRLKSPAVDANGNPAHPKFKTNI